jgi:hypothetical protein
MAQETQNKNRRITISVADHVVDAARELGARRHLSLSRVIAEAILAERRGLLEQEMAEGYRALGKENHSTSTCGDRDVPNASIRPRSPWSTTPRM